MVNFMKNFKLDKDVCWHICLAFCLSALVLISPELVFADGGTVDESSDPFGCYFMRITDTVTGPTGRGIATVGIVFLGIGLFLGKISWGIAIAVGLGVAAIFGADTLIEWASGKETSQMTAVGCRT